MSFFRDFTQFTRWERRGILMLLLIMTALILYIFFYKELVPSQAPDAQVFADLKSSFYEELPARQELSTKKDEPNSSHTHKFKGELFAFNPNTISKKDLLRLGLSEKQVAPILKYRTKGGVFRRKEDFKRMYTVSDQFYERVEAYIVLETKDKAYEENSSVMEHPKPVLLVDLSAATVAELKRVKGIGDKLADRIVAYRKLLGGYASVEQLKEVYGMSSENYKRIIPQVKAGAIFQKLQVNTIQGKVFWKHPYVRNWDVVNKLVNERENNGPFENAEDFQLRLNLEDSTMNKLKHYLIY